MYYYIYDTFTSEAKYAKKLDKIGLKLAKLGIFDEKVKATPIRKVENLTEEALRNEKVRNIIAVGDDGTASKIINVILRQTAPERKITFGIIPVRFSKIAYTLGIPSAEQAPEIISARKKTQIDLGLCDSFFFLTSFKISLPTRGKKVSPLFDLGSIFRNVFSRRYLKIQLKFDDRFVISSKISELFIINALSKEEIDLMEKKERINLGLCSPRDGFLNVLVVSQGGKAAKAINYSFLKANQLEFSIKNSALLEADGQQIKGHFSKIKVIPRCLDVIVGKGRNF